MTEDEAKAALREWILKKSSAKVDSLADDTPLIEQKILSSLHIMDLVLFVEKLSGKRPELKSLKPESFKTLNSIYAAFF